jgi:hypothetical protein
MVSLCVEVASWARSECRERLTVQPSPTFSNSGFGAESRLLYAREAERKMGQLLELAKKNTGAKGIGPICHPSFTLVYSGSTRKTVAVETDGTVHLGYFFSLAWSTPAFSSGSLISDKVRSNS